MPKSKVKYSDTTRLEIVRLYVEEQQAIVRVAKGLRIGVKAVKQILNEANVTLRTPREIALLAPESAIKTRFIKGCTFPKEMLERREVSRQKAYDKNSRGFRVTSDGYLEYTRQPLAGVLVHRYIAEKFIAMRPLAKDEVVHHRNGIRTDNRIENLEIMTRSEHAKHHSEVTIEIANAARLTSVSRPIQSVTE
jgi:transposase-like protein